MALLEIYKQSNMYKVLSQDIAKGSVSHTYMLLLPDKLLAQEYAKFFAMQLYCLDNHSVCCKCANCNKIMHGNMGDIKYFPKNTRLSVEESRQIVSESLVMPYENNKKIFIISDFGLATPQAQNALLKVLEEPTASNIFLLTSDSETTVLTTILSRAKKIIEHSINDEQLCKELKSRYSESDDRIVNEAVALSKGNLTLACDMVANKAYQQLNKDILTVISSLKASSDVLKQSVILNRYKDNFAEVLDIMLQTFLDIKIAITTDVVPNRIKGFEEFLKGYTPKSVTHITKIILECKNRLKFNCAILGVIDYLLFGILEAKFICK